MLILWNFWRKKWNLYPILYGLVFSKIKTKIQDLGGIKLQNQFPRIIKLLKKYQEGYTPKHADVFSLDQLRFFFDDSSNEGKNMLYKASVCFSMYGGLRCADLVCIQNDKLSFDDNAGIWVSYTLLKTSWRYNKENSFLI